MTYSDIIQLNKDFHPVFQLQDEPANYWRHFIPTPQFYELLEKVLKAVTPVVSPERKSFWVQGTFGTGKSHAGSVFRHLLCDPLDDIKTYIDERVKNPPLSAQLLNLRKNKKFLPVILYASEMAYDPHRLTLVIQGKVQDALHSADASLTVNSDFERMFEYVQNLDATIWGVIFSGAGELQEYARTKEEVLVKLRARDCDVYLKLEAALAKHEIRPANPKK